jgi:hypothetical protein
LKFVGETHVPRTAFVVDDLGRQAIEVGLRADMYSANYAP